MLISFSLLCFSIIGIKSHSAFLSIVSGQFIPNTLLTTSLKLYALHGFLDVNILLHGHTVRKLQASIDAAVKVLLDLKAEYKKVTGQDYKAPGGAGAGARAKKEKPAKQEKAQVRRARVFCLDYYFN